MGWAPSRYPTCLGIQLFALTDLHGLNRKRAIREYFISLDFHPAFSLVWVGLTASAAFGTESGRAYLERAWLLSQGSSEKAAMEPERHRS